MFLFSYEKSSNGTLQRVTPILETKHSNPVDNFEAEESQEVQ